MTGRAELSITTTSSGLMTLAFSDHGWMPDQLRDLELPNHQLPPAQGGCQRAKWSPRTSLTEYASSSHRSQVGAGLVLAGRVPLACHIERASSVSSGQPRPLSGSSHRSVGVLRALM
jgi:hypothetical protein